jgi:hypothetical protein|tara:strand:- start:19774 stop:19995 length:222 start_codon:yes stop_codon:yes gene_type:complete
MTLSERIDQFRDGCLSAGELLECAVNECERLGLTRATSFLLLRQIGEVMNRVQAPWAYDAEGVAVKWVWEPAE